MYLHFISHCSDKIPWPKQCRAQRANCSSQFPVSSTFMGIQGSKNLKCLDISTVKIRKKNKHIFAYTPLTFSSHTVLDLLPREWWHPWWADLPTSVNVIKIILTNMSTVQSQSDDYLMRLFPGYSLFCQFHKTHHHSGSSSEKSDLITM